MAQEIQQYTQSQHFMQQMHVAEANQAELWRSFKGAEEEVVAERLQRQHGYQVAEQLSLRAQTLTEEIDNGHKAMRSMESNAENCMEHQEQILQRARSELHQSRQVSQNTIIDLQKQLAQSVPQDKHDKDVKDLQQQLAMNQHLEEVSSKGRHREACSREGGFTEKVAG